MNKRSEQNADLSRRDLVKSAAAVGLAFTAGVQGAPQAAAAAAAAPTGDSPIRKENAKPGTRDWMLTKTDIDDIEPVNLWRSPRIEGYCSETALGSQAIDVRRPGLRVSTQMAHPVVEVIDRNKKDVGPRRRGKGGCGAQAHQAEKQADKSRRFHLLAHR